MRWEDLREEEFKDAIDRCGGLCVLPIGCIEKHGQHLPVGTDSLHGIGIAERAAAKEEVCVFPAAMWLGDVVTYHSLKHPAEQRMSGYISLEPYGLIKALTELCEEIARNGFRKILILNAHGGNVPFLDYFVRSYAYERRDHAVMWTWSLAFAKMEPVRMYKQIAKARKGDFKMVTDEDMETLARFAETGCGGGHADLRETGLIMGMYPELVAEDRFLTESGLSTHRADYLTEMGIHTGNEWISNFPNAYEGYAPVGCTETLGEAMVHISVNRLCKIFRRLKADEDCVRMAMGLPRAD